MRLYVVIGMRGSTPEVVAITSSSGAAQAAQGQHQADAPGVTSYQVTEHELAEGGDKSADLSEHDFELNKPAPK